MSNYFLKDDKLFIRSLDKPGALSIRAKAVHPDLTKSNVNRTALRAGQAIINIDPSEYINGTKTLDTHFGKNMLKYITDTLNTIVKHTMYDPNDTGDVMSLQAIEKYYTDLDQSKQMNFMINKIQNGTFEDFFTSEVRFDFLNSFKATKFEVRFEGMDFEYPFKASINNMGKTNFFNENLFNFNSYDLSFKAVIAVLSDVYLFYAIDKRRMLVTSKVLNDALKASSSSYKYFTFFCYDEIDNMYYESNYRTSALSIQSICNDMNRKYEISYMNAGIPLGFCSAVDSGDSVFFKHTFNSFEEYIDSSNKPKSYSSLANYYISSAIDTGKTNMDAVTVKFGVNHKQFGNIYNSNYIDSADVLRYVSGSRKISCVGHDMLNDFKKINCTVEELNKLISTPIGKLINNPDVELSLEVSFYTRGGGETYYDYAELKDKKIPVARRDRVFKMIKDFCVEYNIELRDILTKLDVDLKRYYSI